jgi:CAAX prenyl protease-like protein
MTDASVLTPRSPEPPTSSDAPTRAAGTLAWVGPFAVFALWLAVDKWIPLANPWREILRDIVLLAAIVGFSRDVLPRRAPFWLASIGVGLGVFVLWIAPELLVPGWRAHWLFQNSVTGQVKTSIPLTELTPLLLALRTARAALIVPVVEELFWRGWLPRWLQNTEFERVPLGHYTAFAFWSTAVLFALEHGPYWEVGLVCGVIYNWWMRRTRSLGDLVIVHAVTNLALSVYVIVSGRWGFWM